MNLDENLDEEEKKDEDKNNEDKQNKTIIEKNRQRKKRISKRKCYNSGIPDLKMKPKTQTKLKKILK